MGNNFVNMARPKRLAEPIVAAPQPPTGPEYPYRLCIRLDERDLARLGLEAPQVGDILEFSAMAKVTSYSESSNSNADGISTKHCSAELQITDMNVEGESSAETFEEKGEEY